MAESPETLPITRIFFDANQKLRSGWRFFLFFSLFMVASFLVGGFLSAIFGLLPVGFSSNSLIARVGGSIVGLILALGIGWVCAKVFEGLPFRSLGASFTKGWIKDFGLGILFGSLSIGLAVLIAAAFGGLRFSFNGEAGSSALLLTLAVTFVIFLFGAAFEEALMRGYMLQTFMRSNLTPLGLILTSFLFASGHLGNNAAALFSTANTVLAGVWLAVGYLRTRTLWFATGLHLAWNWVQGSFFGIEVSGFADFATAPLFKEIDNGPAIVSGGDYGIEGGVACTIALAVSAAAIWFLPFLKANAEMTALTSAPKEERKEA
ncbi:MAG: CPBP family intramembrane metalloprotease [Pyrinomonadaceae bacterium]|nr:CPBP family intramembrane metalloprotease [Pyrinomonadaceae bacterium]